MNNRQKIDHHQENQPHKRLLGTITASLMASLLLAACGAPTPAPQISAPQESAPASSQIASKTAPIVDNQTDDDEQSQNVSEAQTDTQIVSAVLDETDDNASEDVVGSIIWQLEQADKSQTSNTDQTPPPSFEELIPTGPDPSLAEEALDAAFAMLKQPESEALSSSFKVAPKADTHMRIGVFLPHSGRQSALGMQIDQGLQMAYFQIANPLIELVYFDTDSSGSIETIAKDAIAAEIDIAVGPLFSDKAAAILPLLGAADIPILSFSNNQQIATSGLWVMGLLPEQQMDILLGQALSQGYQDIAILADSSLFGQRMSEHILNRLTAFGMTPSAYQPIEVSAASDDEFMISEIKRFARYVPLEDGELISDRPAPYDLVILAGGPDFIIKVAPLLSYYDLGPDRVAYLGTDFWANPALTGEPSLQQAYIAAISPDLSAAFSQRHHSLYGSQSSLLGQLGFDVMAVAMQALAQGQNELDSLQNPLIASLIREQGFKGYTGSFKLAANGLNYRDYVIYQLAQGQLVPTDIPPVPEDVISKASSDQRVILAE